jgi:Protein kinase domain
VPQNLRRSCDFASLNPMFTNMAKRLTRFPGSEKEEAEKTLHQTVSQTSTPRRLPQINQTVSRHLPMAIKVQSPWTEYKPHVKTKQAGDVIIAYDRKIRDFAIKEVRGCDRDWLLRLKAISHANIVRFVASYFHEGSIYLVCDLMSTSLANVLSVSRLPISEIATACKDVITGFSYVHNDLKISYGVLNCENILLCKSGDVKLGMLTYNEPIF